MDQTYQSNEGMRWNLCYCRRAQADPLILKCGCINLAFQPHRQYVSLCVGFPSKVKILFLVSRSCRL